VTDGLVVIVLLGNGVVMVERQFGDVGWEVVVQDS